ncbi:MAG: RagB/SusD family nutrient uptake outer membrane protein [Candidatus Cryptobacteroides sp.]
MKKYIIAISAAIVALTGCKDFLVEDPILSQSDNLTLSTIEGLNQATAGAYSPLASSSWYGADFVLINELKTSNGKKYIGSSFDSGRCNDMYNINYNENNTSALWGYAYYVISAANNVIDNLGEKGSEQERNNLKAECLFLRALSHFDLVRTYAQPYNYTADASHDGVPVVLHTEPSAKPARESVAKVYEQIIADLTEAENIIDPEYVRAGTDAKAFVSIYAIQALLSRVYLYKEDWENSALYAKKVIDSKKFEMWTPAEVKDAECYKVDVPKGGEVIFEVYGLKANSYDGYHDGISPMTGPNGYGDAGCSKDLMGLYEESDVRSTLFQNSGEVYWTAKYIGKGLGKPDASNVIVLRLSEMYLNIAEAVANGVSGYDGVGAMATIANNRGATPQPLTKDGVFTERTKELAWEAHLWFDLARTKRTMTRTDYIGDEAGKTVEPGDYRWAMPIPFREYGVNPNLTHNPGYTN